MELKKGLKDALYDSLTYQLSLRCFHDLFKSDAESTVDEIQFTGYIRGVSAATGTDQETVILSARCTRQSFDKINLALVEPASFFLALQKATQTKPHLFKPVSLPAVVPNSGDDGLPLVRNATGGLFCILSYAGQSVLARILASCRPDRWEHELTVELLRSMIREFTPKLKPNSPSALAEPTDAREFSELLSHAYERATAALNQIAEIVRDELMSSWGAPGIAGDAVGILDAVNHVAFQLAALLEVENAFAGTSAPKGLEAVPKAVIGMTQECMESCLRIADDIESAALQETVGTAVRLDYSLSVDRYFSQAAKEVQVFVNSQRW